jgi:hypothetical protein
MRQADGQVLFNRHDVPVHAALPVIARTLRAGLTHYLVEDGELLVKPDDETDYEVFQSRPCVIVYMAEIIVMHEIAALMLSTVLFGGTEIVVALMNQR